VLSSLGRGHRAASLRFVALGASNTAVTTLLFLLLASHLSYAVSYILSFLTGVLINSVFVPVFVFREKRRLQMSLGIAGWSLVVMALGAALSAVCQHAGLRPLPTAVAVAVVVLPTNFFVSRFIVASTRQSRDDAMTAGQ
jgi:putative flippase GtrA